MPQNSIVKLHDKVLDFLLDWRKKNPGFTFSLRKSDIGKKLSDGYWFFGTDEVIIISFWSGFDMKGTIPNISFCYNILENTSYIQLATRDSGEKAKAINEVFVNQLTPEFSEGGFYFKTSPSITTLDILGNLKTFLEKDKIIIDELISKNKKLFNTKQNTRNRIGFISELEFTRNLNRILKYRESKKSKGLPISLSSITIKNYGPIKKVTIGNIPADCQWIFLTGENGSGKSSILRAMATSFVNGNIKLNTKNITKSNYSIKLSLSENGKRPLVTKVISTESLNNKTPKLLTKGFVAFGPIRLNIASDEYAIKFDRNRIFNNPYLNLFNTSGFLLDIGTIYNSKAANTRYLIRGNEDKIQLIIQAILKVCDSIVDIHFGRNVIYYEADSNKKLVNDGVPFKDLASGFKSIIAMVSHMMLILFNQQKDINDPAELCGIVIIDEIDLHFHPKMQRELVVKLSEVFPRVQFIASTHSPIPLLGAPSNAAIFTVARNSQKGIYVERMDHKVAFDRILPNAILTSPIFGLDNIVPESHSATEILRTEDSFDEITFNDRVRTEINNYLTDTREIELLNLFAKKDEARKKG